MNKKSPIKAMTAIAVLAAVFSALIRVFITFNYTEAKTTVFERTSPIPLIYSYALLAIVLIIAIGGFIIQKRSSGAEINALKKSEIISVLPGLALLISSLCLLFKKFIENGNLLSPIPLFELLMLVSALISCLYYFCITAKKNQSNAFMIFSIGPILWGIAALLYMYFDMSILIASTNRVFTQLAYLSFIYFAYAESKAIIKKNNRFEYMSAAAIASILLLTSSIPNFFCGDILKAGISDNIYIYFAQLVCGIYAALKLLITANDN